MKEGREAISAQDVQDGLNDVELLLDNGLARWIRSSGQRRICHCSADSLTGLRLRWALCECWLYRLDGLALTLTTQMGLDRTDVAAPECAADCELHGLLKPGHISNCAHQQ